MSDTEKLLENVQERVTKAIFEASDLSTGGKLNAEQADQFLDKVIDSSAIVPETRTVRMRSPQRLIEKIGFDSRIMVAPPAQGSAPAGGDIKEPTTGKVTLTTVEAAAFVDVGFDTLEDNIERDGLEDHIVNLVATRVATDLEELYLKGDTASGDTFLALNDGWFKLATSNVYDHASAAFSEDAVFGAMIDALPNKYQPRNPNEWRIYVAPKLERKVRRERAARQTGGGDTWLTGSQPLEYAGFPIVPVPLLPATASASGNALLCHPKNLVVGLQRDIDFDNFRNGRLRVYQMTWTIRSDVQYEFEDAVVKGINIVA